MSIRRTSRRCVSGMTLTTWLRSPENLWRQEAPDDDTSFCAMLRRGVITAAGTLTFWGVRGSIPAPGLHTITFGGNTSSVSVKYHEHVIIFDAGTGLRQLGLALMAREKPPITGSLFLTHTHWDHILCRVTVTVRQQCADSLPSRRAHKTQWVKSVIAM